MKTGFIKITDSFTVEIKLVNDTVWVTANEISGLFGVNIPTINKYLKEIFKDNFLRENEVMREYRYTRPKQGECIRIYYNLDVIICLSFKIQSLYTKIFRQWIFRSFGKYTQVEKAYNTFINCDLIIKEYSSLNLN